MTLIQQCIYRDDIWDLYTKSDVHCTPGTPGPGLVFWPDTCLLSTSSIEQMTWQKGKRAWQRKTSASFSSYLRMGTKGVAGCIWHLGKKKQPRYDPGLL